MNDATKLTVINFLKAFTRLLVQSNLYKSDHPQVKEAAEESVKNANLFFSSEAAAELSLTLEQGRLLVNGAPFLQSDKLPNSLLNVFKKLNMDTMTFSREITERELVLFAQIHNAKERPEEYLKNNGITNARLQKSVYTKSSPSAQETPEPQKEKKTDVHGEIASKNFEQGLQIIVSRLTPDEREQKELINTLFDKFKTEVEEKINKAVEGIKREKTKIENDYVRTEAVVSNIANGILTIDKDGNIIMMDGEAQAMTGKPLKEVSGKKIFDITNIENQVLNLASEIRSENAKAIDKEIKTKAKEDLAKTIKNSTALVKNEEGKIVGAISMPTDMAKIKELEKLKEDFISSMTHELRSPLTSIKMALDLLSREKLAPGVSAMLNTAIRNSERLNSIISDILDFSKLQSGKMIFKLTENDPREIAKNALDSMKAWGASKNITLSLINEGNLPPVHADSRRSEQVLINLLSNALKFTPAGGRIQISVDRGKNSLSNFVFFSVRDTGCGIKKEDQSRIFEKFVQAASGEKTGGTGLGLAITKAMTVMQGGTITLESEEGKGSTFRISLPVFRQQADSAEGIGPLEKKAWWKKLFGI